VTQAQALDASQLLSADTTLTSALTKINPQFAVQSAALWGQVATQCVGAVTDTTGLNPLPGYMNTVFDSSTEADFTTQCQSAGRVQLMSCANGGIYAGINGQRSPVPGDLGTAVFSCPSPVQVPAVWYTAAAAPPQPPHNLTCINGSAGIAQCRTCGNFSVCHPPLKQPPNMQAMEQQLALGNTSVGNYGGSGTYCLLDVVTSGKTRITLKPRNPPCLTAGEMYIGQLNGSVTVEVNTAGWAVQASGSGFLFWLFYGTPQKPADHNETFNVSVIPAPGFCMASDCRCNSWDCDWDPVCKLAHATNWDSCKCAFIGGDHNKPSAGCRIISILLYILFWGGIAVLTLTVFLAVLHKLCSTSQQKTSYI
jgi:hypothetical protein